MTKKQINIISNDQINSPAIYQTENGGLELSIDNKKETIWANLNQISILFGKDKSVISRHIKNIFESNELNERETVAFFATVQQEGEKFVERNIVYYNLDLILSVGYRVNSKNATKFRQWATSILHKHIVDGYTINENRIKNNYNNFIEAIENIKSLLPNDNKISNNDVLELVKTYANTWFSLDAYDRDNLIKNGRTKEYIELTSIDLMSAIKQLKDELIKKGEATELFATERQKDSLESIFGNIMQSFGGIDLYPSVEEKASNLLYFMIKNHPFIDGNKRSGAYSFIWFLQKNKLLNLNKITPEALTALTLLIAESNPKDKEKMVRLVLQILQ